MNLFSLKMSYSWFSKISWYSMFRNDFSANCWSSGMDNGRAVPHSDKLPLSSGLLPQVIVVAKFIVAFSMWYLSPVWDFFPPSVGGCSVPVSRDRYKNGPNATCTMILRICEIIIIYRIWKNLCFAFYDALGFSSEPKLYDIYVKELHIDKKIQALITWTNK